MPRWFQRFQEENESLHQRRHQSVDHDSLKDPIKSDPRKIT